MINKDKLEETYNSIKEVSNSKVFIKVADLSKAKDIDELFKESVSELGSIDILINNAGGPPPSNFDNTTDEQWESAFNLTMMSSVRLSRLVLPQMKENNWGRIINISSVSIKTPVNGLFLSNSIRMGVLGWSKALSDEVAASGITVNSVCPGSTRTKRITDIFDAQSKATGKSIDEIEKAASASIPMQKIGEPEDM